MNLTPIAFLCHPYHRGGVTRWMADAAVFLAKKGCKVYFITIEPSKEFFSGKGRETLLQLLENNKDLLTIIKTKQGFEFEFGTPEYKVAIYKQLIANNLPIGTPIILADDGAVWASATSLYQSYPIVGVLHSDEPHYYELCSKYYHTTDILSCVSIRIKHKVLAEQPHFSSEKLVVIPCGINLPVLKNRTKPNAEIKIIYVGRIGNYQKRVSDLFNVCMKLHKSHVAFHIDIVGDGGEDKQQLQNKFQYSPIKDQVIFHGWQSQQRVAELLHSSDILLLTSDFEGTPIAMMEALACGCGFVGTKVSGVEDYENHTYAYPCFRIFDIGDIENAAQKIKELATVSYQEREHAARQLAEQEFSMEKCMDRYLRAIDTVEKRTYIQPKVNINRAAHLKSYCIAFTRLLKMKYLHKK